MPLIFPSIVNKKNFACNRVNDKSANVRQKLNMMETALSYLTTNKWQLNSSAEKARFDIRKTTEQKITMLREQEYKLVEEVDHLLQHEQQRLEEQIENLNQAIGTCKFVVGKEHAFVDENGLEELISAELEQRINLLAKMANSSECANIVFNANFSERNCQQSATIGQIFVEFSDGPLSQHLIKPNHLDNFTSSPYDNWLMPQRHLSRNRSSNSTCSSDDTAQAEEQPPNNGANIRDRLTSTTSLSVASFDVISAGGCLNGGGGVTDHFGTSVPLTVFSQQHQLQTNSFAAYFRELNCLPIDHWLWPSSTANGSKKGTPIAAGAVPSPQHSFLPNNIAEMFSKINMDTNERQLQQQHHHSFSSASINSVAKNHQKAQPRKRSVGADGNGNQLGGQPNDGTTNWAKAELSFWLKASKGVPSSAVSSANVINSVMASARDQWLLAAPATANNPITLSTSVRDAAAVLQPPDAKIARHQTHGAPFVISKNAQQLLDINKNKNSELPTLAELEEDTLDKLAKKFEMNAYIKPTEHFVHPTNISKHFHFSSRTNGDAIGSGADTAVAPTNADQQDHDASHTTLLSPLSVEDDETKGNSQSALEMSKTTKPLLALPTDPSHWLKRYPPPKQNRPMNEMAEDLYCWESVLGWKSILEKIHGSGEDGWLAPSSRAIKNTSTE